jgi:hypothetical protein
MFHIWREMAGPVAGSRIYRLVVAIGFEALVWVTTTTGDLEAW